MDGADHGPDVVAQIVLDVDPLAGVGHELSPAIVGADFLEVETLPSVVAVDLERESWVGVDTDLVGGKRDLHLGWAGCLVAGDLEGLDVLTGLNGLGLDAGFHVLQDTAATGFRICGFPHFLLVPLASLFVYADHVVEAVRVQPLAWQFVGICL